jgi:hypothetical protein
VKTRRKAEGVDELKPQAGDSEVKLCRKIHSNAILKNLPPKKQAEIIAYAEANSYVETAKWLQKDDIPVTAELVSRFRDSYLLMQGFYESSDFALEMTQLCIEKGWVKTAQEERAAAQTFFNRAVLKKGDPKLWAMVERVNLLKDRVGLEEQKLELQSRKYKDKTAKGKKADDSGLSAEEKDAAVKQILGIA